MKIKKYTAPTMPEAMSRIRKELGSEAVILNSKVIAKGGFLGFFKKKKIEVIAALDPDPQPVKRGGSDKKKPDYNIGHKPNDNTVLEEIRHLKKMINIQSQQMTNNYPDNYQIVYRYLLEQEVEQSLASQLVEAVYQRHKENNSDFLESKAILADVQSEIEHRLENVYQQKAEYDAQIVQFVGPTGVGKTTTIAKVAAAAALKENKKVAFITTDTYRIAAIEQLKTYARILNVPVEVAYNTDDYKQALKKFASYDLILVDTAGRNYRDRKYIVELNKLIDMKDNLKTYLVLSLTTKPNDITAVYEQFQQVPINEVIFTKLDETKQYGNMLSIVLNKQIVIAFLTNGQGVPDDILHASPHVISSYAAGEF